VLGDLQLAVPHALDAPQPAVVVDGGALAGPPGHGDDAVAVFRAAIQLAAGVVVLDRLVHAVGQAHAGVADDPAHGVAQGGGDRVHVARGDRLVHRGDEPVAAFEGDVGQG